MIDIQMEGEVMKIRLLYILILQIFLVLMMTGCVTPTISDTIKMRQINPTACASGNISKSYLVVGGGVDSAEKVICKKDGSCILFGDGIKSFGESGDFLVAELSSDLELLWANTYGAKGNDWLFGAITVSDDSFLLYGESYSMFYTPLPGFYQNSRPLLVRINSRGDVEWASTIEEVDSQNLVHTGYLSLIAGTRTSDKGYVLVGKSYATVNTIFLIKFSETNELLWSYHYNVGITGEGYAVAEGDDGKLFIAGLTTESDSEGDLVLLTTDAEGQPLWSKIYHAEGKQEPYSLLVDKNRDVVITGTTIDYLGKNAIFALKSSSNGVAQWFYSYEGDVPWSTVIGYANTYVIVGRKGDKSNYDAMALLIDEDGQYESSLVIKEDNSDEFTSAFFLGDNNFLLFGQSLNYDAEYRDMLVMKWNSKGNNNSVCNNVIVAKEPLKIHGENIQAKTIPASIKLTPVPLGTIANFDVKKLSIEKIEK